MSQLNLWHVSDLERILNSKAQAASRYSDDIWRDGYLAALEDLAVEFGINMHAPASQPTTIETTWMPR